MKTGREKRTPTERELEERVARAIRGAHAAIEALDSFRARKECSKLETEQAIPEPGAASS